MHRFTIRIFDYLIKKDEDDVYKIDKFYEAEIYYRLAYFNLGNCYLYLSNERKNYDLAKDKYCKAEQLSPQFKPVKKMLASMNPSNISMVIDTEEVK